MRGATRPQSPASLYAPSARTYLFQDMYRNIIFTDILYRTLTLVSIAWITDKKPPYKEQEKVHSWTRK